MRSKQVQISFLLMLFLSGCSNRTPEKSINDFWTWFSNDVAVEQLAHLAATDDTSTGNKITQKLQAINKNLTWQSGAKEGIKRELIISAGGVKKLFPLVKEVVGEAPTMKYWKVIAFKPRIRKLVPVEVDGMRVSPEDIFFTAQPHDGVVDVSILLDHTIPPATAEKIAVVMLNQSLGEYDAATKIGKISFAPITELNEDNSNFRELRKAVDDYCK